LGGKTAQRCPGQWRNPAVVRSDELRQQISDALDALGSDDTELGEMTPAVREVVRWPEKVSDFWRGVTERGLGLLS
jgi:hypothetical protein